MFRKLVVSVVILGSAALVAQIPAGWKVVKSPKAYIAPGKYSPGGRCQIAVPPDWTLQQGTVGFIEFRSLDGRADVQLQERPGDRLKTFSADLWGTYLQNKEAEKETFGQDLVVGKVLTKTATRFAQVVVNSEGAGVTNWHVLAAGNPLCGVFLSIGDTNPAYKHPPGEMATVKKLQAQASKIVASFGRAH